jgi:hypothetical protein
MFLSTQQYLGIFVRYGKHRYGRFGNAFAKAKNMLNFWWRMGNRLGINLQFNYTKKGLKLFIPISLFDIQIVRYCGLILLHQQ